MIVNRGNTDQIAEVMINDTSREFVDLGNGRNFGLLEPNQKLPLTVEANGCSVLLAVDTASFG